MLPLAKFCTVLLSDFVRSLNIFYFFMCLKERLEKKIVKEGERDREASCVSVCLPPCVFWVNSRLMNCLATAGGCERPGRPDPVDAALVNNALPQLHNSQSSSKRLADPNGNVIFQIKDGQALMRGGVMGGV